MIYHLEKRQFILEPSEEDTYNLPKLVSFLGAFDACRSAKRRLELMQIPLDQADEFKSEGRPPQISQSTYLELGQRIAKMTADIDWFNGAIQVAEEDIFRDMIENFDENPA